MWLAKPNPHNWRYLETKRDKLGHFIDMPGWVLRSQQPRTAAGP